MKSEQLIEMLQSDLRHERKHLGFYTQASVMIRGLHREELREFLANQAKDELQHVMQFSEAIVHLGGTPGTECEPYQFAHTDAYYLLRYAEKMEQEVADRYAERLRSLSGMETTAMAYLSVFYEDQIKDSQRTAWELRQMHEIVN